MPVRVARRHRRCDAELVRRLLVDPAARKPSEHTIQAYRQDFTAVAALLMAGSRADIALTDITKHNMRAVFATYASTNEPA